MLVDGVEVRCGADDCPGADECYESSELMDGPDPEDVMWDEVEPQITEEWMKEQKQKQVEGLHSLASRVRHCQRDGAGSGYIEKLKARCLGTSQECEWWSSSLRVNDKMI
jgi:hypothetical protein